MSSERPIHEGPCEILDHILMGSHSSRRILDAIYLSKGYLVTMRIIHLEGQAWKQLGYCSGPGKI